MKKSSPISIKYIRLLEYIASEQETIKASDVYELCHLALGKCPFHPDWKEKWDKIYEQVKINL